jgi:hypothetical protein
VRLARRLTDWFRVHPKVFSVIGILIALLTFTIKEWWRDSVKEDLSGLDSAATTFDLSNTIYEGNLKIFGTVQKDIVAPSTRDEGYVRLHEHEVLSSFSLSMLLSSETFGKRRHYNDIMPDIIAANICSNTESKKLRAAEDVFATPPAWRPLNDEEIKKMQMAFQEVERAQLDTDLALHRLQYALEHRADEDREAKERLLRMLTIASVALYIVAATIGIIGILADIEIRPGSEGAT